MISKKNFCDILGETIENDNAFDATFDKIKGYVYFVPFYDTHNTTQVLKALSCAIGDNNDFIVDWYLKSKRGAQEFVFEEDGKKYCINDIEDLYYYLVGILEPIN
jgi:hypothetical protein